MFIKKKKYNELLKKNEQKEKKIEVLESMVDRKDHTINGKVTIVMSADRELIGVK